MTVTRNPRQEVQHAHLHAFYAERGETENHESSALAGHPVIGAGYRAFSATLGGDAVKVESDITRLAADVRVAAQPWARADGLKAESDPELGGAINLVRPTLAGAERLHAAQRATAEQRASFGTFTGAAGVGESPGSGDDRSPARP